ncbi:MAG: type II toxin-antitoxin system HicB family antitoxin [Bacteroidota bacterium]
MKDRLRYKEFIGSVHFSSEDEIFYGKIEGINDLITFEGNSVSDLKNAFIEAVEDYVLLCKEAGKSVFKSFKGSFNVRVNPELHSKAYERALLEGKTLNQYVKEAIELKIQSTD